MKASRKSHGQSFGENCLLLCSKPLDGVPGHVAEVIEDAFTIAVDGGLTHARKLGVKPALWVGDADSVKRDELKKANCRRVKLPRAKDYTDLEYALHLAGKAFLEGNWEGNVVLLAAQGGRLDHEIGNMLVVQRWLQDLSAAVGPDQCPGLVSYGASGMWIAGLSQVAFHGRKGELFSVITFGSQLRFTITGARFTIKNRPFEHASMGISNLGIGKTVVVSAHQPVAEGGQSTPFFVMFPVG
jgi:thiamine pyrophosphokinase